jgi:tRNA pseudouridine55 synthase
MRKQINGILLLDKPAGFSSNGALQKVKRLFNAKKAGHTGSLDPIATGMLPICFGEATKFSQFLLESDKVYRVVASLGVETTTGDTEGEIISQRPTDGITQEQIQTILPSFTGALKQIPPMYSAIKRDGKPLYELARKGIEVERAPRDITIHSLQFDKFEGNEMTLRVHCSKGTYIRTLIEDIGKMLGCGAHVKGLRRLSVSPYGESIMYTLPALESILQTAGQQALQDVLLPVETSVQSYPMVKLTTSAAFYIRMGQAVRASFPIAASLVRLMSEDARFLGIGEVMADGRVKPHRMVSSQDSSASKIL